MVRIIEHAQQIVERGADTFFDAANHIEFRAARTIVIDLDVAAEQLSNAYRASHPDIEWKALARTRDKYAHHYEDIDREVVWNLLTIRLPLIRQALRHDTG